MLINMDFLIWTINDNEVCFMTEDNIHKNSNECIYVLLTDTGSWFTRLIKMFTRAPYNHASLALDSNLQDVYSFGRKHAHNPFIAGFVKEDVYVGTFRHFPDTRCVLLRISVTEQQREDMIQIIREFENKKSNCRYNLIGLVALYLQLNIKQKDAYFCSQFVSEIIRRSGIELWERPSTQLTPNDFFNHEKLEDVYEGFLYDYPLLNRHKLAQTMKLKKAAVHYWKRMFSIENIV